MTIYNNWVGPMPPARGVFRIPGTYAMMILENVLVTARQRGTGPNPTTIELKQGPVGGGAVPLSLNDTPGAIEVQLQMSAAVAAYEDYTSGNAAAPVIRLTAKTPGVAGNSLGLGEMDSMGSHMAPEYYDESDPTTILIGWGRFGGWTTQDVVDYINANSTLLVASVISGGSIEVDESGDIFLGEGGAP